MGIGVTMTSKTTINSANIMGGTNPLSQATIHGGVIYLQGCTGRHPTEGTVGTGIEGYSRGTAGMDMTRNNNRNKNLMQG